MPTKANNTKNRKPNIDFWLQEDNLLRIQGWCRDGLTNDQIAHNMGISHAALYRWIDKSDILRDTLKQTKDVVDRQVENALFKAAMDGNTTAQIFWLKNRKYINWKDKQELDANVSSEVVIKVGIDD